MLGNVKFILIKFLTWSLLEAYSDTFPVLRPIWAESMSEAAADCLCEDCCSVLMHSFFMREVEFGGMKSPIGRNRKRIKETGTTSVTEK